MRVSTLKKNGSTLIEKCHIAESFFARFMGLMGRTSIGEDEAICFPKCNSIHTFFMCMPIDVLFLTSKGEVVDVLPALPAWRMLLPRKGACFAVELKSGLAKRLGIVLGDLLECEGVWG